MRIIISGPAAAFDAETDDEITDPALLRRLDGLADTDGVCSDWLDDPPFDEIDLTGGQIKTEFDECSGLRVVTEYRSPRALTVPELAALAQHTHGQWSDGLGENGLEVTVDGRPILIDFGQLGSTEDALVEQVPEHSPPLPRFRKLFTAIRLGDVEALHNSIADGDDLNCQKAGMPPLQWAIAFGHVEAALLLIESGAEVMAEDVMGETALECCAATRDLSDEAAVLIAVAVLNRCSGVAGIERHRQRALELARCRKKENLATLLAGRLA